MRPILTITSAKILLPNKVTFTDVDVNFGRDPAHSDPDGVLITLHALDLIIFSFVTTALP